MADCVPSPTAPKAVARGDQPGSDRLFAGHSTNIHCRPGAAAHDCPLRGAAAFLLLGFALLLASLPLELGVLRKVAVVTLLAAICVVLTADLYQMFATGAGFGRLGRGVIRSSTPASFWLHIVIRVILLLLFVLPLLIYVMR